MDVNEASSKRFLTPELSETIITAADQCKPHATRMNAESGKDAWRRGVSTMYALCPRCCDASTMLRRVHDVREAWQRAPDFSGALMPQHTMASSYAVTAYRNAAPGIVYTATPGADARLSGDARGRT